jgi:hypothetical protein
MVDPIEFAYMPNGVEYRYMHRHVFRQWQAISEMIAVAILLFVLYVIVRLFLREYGPFIIGISPSIMEIVTFVFWLGISLGLAGAYLCGALVARFRASLVNREGSDHPYHAGPVRVTLDEKGIHTFTEHLERSIRWPCVEQVVKTPIGLALRLDDKEFIPISDNALPGTLTRKELRHALAVWRGTV